MFHARARAQAEELDRIRFSVASGGDHPVGVVGEIFRDVDRTFPWHPMFASDGWLPFLRLRLSYHFLDVCMSVCVSLCVCVRVSRCVGVACACASPRTRCAV